MHLTRRHILKIRAQANTLQVSTPRVCSGVETLDRKPVCMRLTFVMCDMGLKSNINQIVGPSTYHMGYQ
jgi:hypothetical protein